MGVCLGPAGAPPLAHTVSIFLRENGRFLSGRTFFCFLLPVAQERLRKEIERDPVISRLGSSCGAVTREWSIKMEDFGGPFQGLDRDATMHN